MHFSSDGTTGFLGKNSFINNFSKSDVLIIQLSVDVSPKWLIFRQDKLHWGAAGS